MIIMKHSYLILFHLIIMALFLMSCQEETIEAEDIHPAISVRVLNGCGFSNVAGNYRDYLQQFNIDVIGTGNADKFIFNKSIIVAKRDDGQDLQRLIKYTGINRYIYAFNEHSDEAFQIVLGRDYLEYMK